MSTAVVRKIGFCKPIALPFVVALLFSGGCAVFAPKPPVATVRPHVTTIHGQTRVDEYHWLRERDNPEVIAYLEAENTYTERLTKHTRALQDALFLEMKARIKETDLEVPVKIDDYYYYTRTQEGKQYRIRCRKHQSLDAPEEVLLDENELAQGHDYFRIGAFRVSPNHELLAYSMDTAGHETYTIYVKDLKTGGLRLDEIPNTYYGLAWGNDNRTFFYTTLDAAKRPHKLFRHTLGADAKDDVLVHHETDERFFVGIDKTRSRQYILLSLGSQITDEVHFLNADEPSGAFAVIHPREQGMEYRVEHHGDDFYIVTNDSAINFRLMKAPVASPSKGNWSEVIPHRPGVKLDGVDAFKDHLAIYERDNGLRTLRIRHLPTGEEHSAEFPEPVYTYFASGNEEFDTSTLRFMYTSLVTPRSVYDYDMKTRQRVLMKRDEVLGGYDPSQYESERIFATAQDGTRVPISLVYRQGTARDGRNPLLLNGYGSYGAPSDPWFSSARLSLLDRGFIFAIAHIRGGGDMGRPWYEDGKLLHKKNTFTDFIACAEHLVAEGYTSSDRLGIMGGSAGGLLMGAVVNMRPDLFRACIAGVPFVDVINTMLDSSIPLTVIEYEEWGNPNDPAYFEYMLSYSPYDNVTAQAYPNMLITAGLNDPRVQYWEPAKWTARLRTTHSGDNVVLLKTNMGAGHGGASGRYDALKETAFEYAFLLDVLGVSN
jgi:oligopeptidase B